MLIYTPLPLECVFDGFNQKRSFKQLSYHGVKLIVEEVDSNQGRISQILSTNPEDFLNPLLQPGNIVYYSQLTVKPR
ncbi:YlzJ-like family protein [Bacillota bacterium LX-D]|nr:YlzJ-like family protein [Bacillota bacterium LX-D]